MENKAALRAKGENRMLQKSQEEPKKNFHMYCVSGRD